MPVSARARAASRAFTTFASTVSRAAREVTSSTSSVRVACARARAAVINRPHNLVCLHPAARAARGPTVSAPPETAGPSALRSGNGRRGPNAKQIRPSTAPPGRDLTRAGGCKGQRVPTRARKGGGVSRKEGEAGRGRGKREEAREKAGGRIGRGRKPPGHLMWSSWPHAQLARQSTRRL